MKRERTILAAVATMLAVMAVMIASCEDTRVEITEIDYRLKLSNDTLYLKAGESGSVRAEYVMLEDGQAVSSKDVSDDPQLVLKSLREDIAETDGHRITAVAPGNAVVNMKYEKANTSLIVAVSDSHEDYGNDDKNDQGTTEDEFSVSLPERIDTTTFKDERLVIQYSYTSPDGQLRCHAGVRQGEIRDLGIVTDKESRTGQIEMTTSGILSTLMVVFKANADTDSITFTLNIHPHEIKAGGTQQLDAVPEGETLHLKYTSTLPDADLQVKTSESWLTASLDHETHEIVVRTEPNTALDIRTAEIALFEASERLSPVIWTLMQGYANEPVEGCVWFECPRLKKAALEQHDADGDREISFEEALAATELDAAGRGVTSVTGLEHFTALRTLDISGNDIPKETVIDLSSPHRSLIYINCDRDDEIDVRGCPSIVEFIEWTPSVIHVNEGQMTTASKPVIHEYVYRSENFEGNEETFLLQQHTRGEGIAIEFYPIGFVDYDYDGGLVEILLRNQIEEFFQYEPMKSFRDCFTITYRKRVTVQRPRERVENTSYKYCEHFDDDPGCNCETANVNRRKELCYIILGNGRSNCLIGNIDLYITEITADETYAHEFGHQFGNLGDEYVELYGKTHPDAGTDKETGRYNTSLSNNPEKVPWSRFLKHPKYKDKVGIYEGAGGYEFGVYKPTPHYKGIMFGSTEFKEFSAPCRYSLFKNIMEKSGLMVSEDYNSKEEFEEAIWEAFLEYDVINDYIEY